VAIRNRGIRPEWVTLGGSREPVERGWSWVVDIEVKRGARLTRIFFLCSLYLLLTREGWRRRIGDDNGGY
jgi:hypothetical protein